MYSANDSHFLIDFLLNVCHINNHELVIIEIVMMIENTISKKHAFLMCLRYRSFIWTSVFVSLYIYLLRSCLYLLMIMYVRNNKSLMNEYIFEIFHVLLIYLFTYPYAKLLCVDKKLI